MSRRKRVRDVLLVGTIAGALAVVGLVLSGEDEGVGGGGALPGGLGYVPVYPRGELAPAVAGEVASVGSGAVASVGTEGQVAVEVGGGEARVEEEMVEHVVRVQVVNAAGDPAEGVVEVTRMERRRRPETERHATDPNGVLVLSLREGGYYVEAVAEGFADSEGERVWLDQAREVTLTLRAAATLRGRVSGPDGRPLVGARVTVWDPRTRAQTGSEGEFAFGDLPEGLYALTFDAEGFVRQRRFEVPVAVDREGFVEVQLEEAGQLEGVVRGLDGQPAAEALVFVFREGEEGGGRGGAEADAAGRFEVEDLAPGEYEVFVRTEDYAQTSRTRVEVQAGRVVVHDVVLAEASRIVGRLETAEGEPAAEVGVLAVEVDGDARRRARTDAEGAFEVENLYPGRYRLLAYLGEDTRTTPFELGEVEVVRGATEVTLSLPPQGRVSGVVFGADGQAVEGAWVFAIVGEEYRGRTRTGSSGEFVIEALDPGPYRLFVRSRGAPEQVAVRAIEVPAGGSVEALQLIARPPAVLEGRVRDRGGSPLAGVTVVLEGISSPVTRRAETDGSGRFRLGPLYDGEYRLRGESSSLKLLAHKRGRVSAKLEGQGVEVALGEAEEVELRVTFHDTEQPR